MIIGKGSLFLGRLTNLSDGASFLVEAPSDPPASGNLTPEDAQRILLEALSELAENLQRKKK
jgi:betaine reductase